MRPYSKVWSRMILIQQNFITGWKFASAWAPTSTPCWWTIAKDAYHAKQGECCSKVDFLHPSLDTRLHMTFSLNHVFSSSCTQAAQASDTGTARPDRELVDMFKHTSSYCTRKQFGISFSCRHLKQAGRGPKESCCPPGSDPSHPPSWLRGLLAMHSVTGACEARCPTLLWLLPFAAASTDKAA